MGRLRRSSLTERRWLLLAAACAAAALAVAGCGGSDDGGSASAAETTAPADTAAPADTGAAEPAETAAEEPAEKPTFALVLNDLTNPVSLALRKGAEDTAERLGFDLKIVGPNPATAQQQIALLEDLSAQEVDGIVLLPVDSAALVPEIDKVVANGIPVVTTELDAPDSQRNFFFFGGAFPLDQGKLTAQRVFEYYTAQGATGDVNYVVTSCLPTVTGQQDRRKGFEDEVAVLNEGSPFQLKQIGFYDTTTDPAKNLANIQNIYTAVGDELDLAYAMCGPDTANWGKVLKQNDNEDVLVAGYDFLPDTLDLIEEGWVGWAQGSSLYADGEYTMTQLFEHVVNGAELPTGAISGDPVFATQENIEEIRQSPDVVAAQG